MFTYERRDVQLAKLGFIQLMLAGELDGRGAGWTDGSWTWRRKVRQSS